MTRHLLTCVGLAIALIGAGLLVAVGSSVGMVRMPFGGGAGVPGAAVLAAAFVATAAGSALSIAALRQVSFELYDVIGFSMAALLVVLLLTGVALREIAAPRAILLGLSVVAASVAVMRLISRLGDEPIELQTNWGGLGGGLGGWRLSGTAVLLVVALSFGGAAIGIGLAPQAGGAAEVLASERSVTLTLRTAEPKPTSRVAPAKAAASQAPAVE